MASNLTGIVGKRAVRGGRENPVGQELCFEIGGLQEFRRRTHQGRFAHATLRFQEEALLAHQTPLLPSATTGALLLWYAVGFILKNHVLQRKPCPTREDMSR